MLINVRISDLARYVLCKYMMFVYTSTTHRPILQPKLITHLALPCPQAQPVRVRCTMEWCTTIFFSSPIAKSLLVIVGLTAKRTW